jgi:hypothetical protein
VGTSRRSYVEVLDLAGDTQGCPLALVVMLEQALAELALRRQSMMIRAPWGHNTTCT